MQCLPFTLAIPPYGKLWYVAILAQSPTKVLRVNSGLNWQSSERVSEHKIRWGQREERNNIRSFGCIVRVIMQGVVISWVGDAWKPLDIVIQHDMTYTHHTSTYIDRNPKPFHWHTFDMEMNHPRDTWRDAMGFSLLILFFCDSEHALI